MTFRKKLLDFSVNFFELAFQQAEARLCLTFRNSQQLGFASV